MATWHQSKNPTAIKSLWTPEPGKWKCIDDKPNQMASSITFATKEEAERYCANTGSIMIPPVGY